MYRNLLIIAAAACLLAGANFATAGEDPADGEQLVIALKTPHFEIAETDISHLAVGESETIVTDSGRTIDLLRTEDGVEVYLDGELLDIPKENQEHVVVKEIEIVCDEGEDCEELTWISEDGDIDIEALEADGAHRVIRIEKTVETDGEDIDVDVHVEHDGPHAGEKVIVIRQTVDESI
jgi:hypothetical protein